MNIISTNDYLPKENTYVLVHLRNPPWTDQHDQAGVQWVVAKFVRGITEEERAAIPITESRRYLYIGSDVHGNNKVPYKWYQFGPDSHFGQDVDFWCELPNFLDFRHS